MSKTLDDLFLVMREGSLSPELKALWGVYRSYENPTKGRGAWPGDELLAVHMGKSPRAVQRYRADLLRRGFLIQHLRGPNPAHYRAVVPEPSGDPEPVKPRQGWRNKEGEASPDLARQGAEASPKGSPSVSPLVSPYNGKGGEGNKKEETSKEERTSDERQKTPPVVSVGGEETAPPPDKKERDPDVMAVFAYWVAARARALKLNGQGPSPKPTKTRLSKVRARLAEGYTVDDLTMAVDGCLSRAFNVELGYVDLELICRDDGHVQQYKTQATKTQHEPIVLAGQW